MDYLHYRALVKQLDFSLNILHCLMEGALKRLVVCQLVLMFFGSVECFLAKFGGVEIGPGVFIANPSQGKRGR